MRQKLLNSIKSVRKTITWSKPISTSQKLFVLEIITTKANSNFDV